VAGGCKLVMVHPRGEGISFQSSLQTQEFARPNCDSPSIVCSNAAEDDDRVVCPACGTLLATRAEFRRFVEWRATCSRLHTSGC
jgi:hypothetical protein